MSRKKKRQLPGTVIRIVSFIPMLNWFALLWLGLKCDSGFSIIFGIGYGVVCFGWPSMAPQIWIAAAIHYAIAYYKISQRPEKKPAPKTGISPKKKPVSEQSQYENWKEEVKNGHYIDTKMSFLWQYIYELLDGHGWEHAQEGYDKLMAVWMGYRKRCPQLDQNMYGWMYDFAWEHQLEYVEPEIGEVRPQYQTAVKNRMIDDHSEEHPLKLTFYLIEEMCDYAIEESKFYQEGNQELIREVIPRVIALADAYLWKQKGRGILALYGPNRTKKQTYIRYRGASGAKSVASFEVSVKAYISSERLRGYLNEIVRFTENALRAMNGSRGRLRNVELDTETADLIEKFLQKEYGKPEEPKAEWVLDFESIDDIREQSDAVREALEVKEEIQDEEVQEEEVQDEEVQEAECIESNYFDQEYLSATMKQCFSAFSERQIRTLYIVLKGDDIQGQLMNLANEQNMMPDLLLDEINEVATQYLDDILIDVFGEEPYVLEQYEEELRRAIK